MEGKGNHCHCRTKPQGKERKTGGVQSNAPRSTKPDVKKEASATQGSTTKTSKSSDISVTSSRTRGSTSRNAAASAGAKNVTSSSTGGRHWDEYGDDIDTSWKKTLVTRSYAEMAGARTSYGSTTVKLAGQNFGDPTNALHQNYMSHTDEHYQCQVPSRDIVPITIDDFNVCGGIMRGCQVRFRDRVHKHWKWGTVRWIGYFDNCTDRILVGIEMTEYDSEGTDGTIGEYKLFHCKQGRGVYKSIGDLEILSDPKSNHWYNYKRTAPPTGLQNEFPVSYTVTKKTDARHCTYNSVEIYATGPRKGIQGDTNSCYLDAMLYSMFTFTSIFDYLLSDEPRPRNTNDLVEAKEIQRILREEIVYPLRKDLYLNRENVWRLRKKLEKIESVKGITGEQMDPEEFMNALFDKVLHATPLLSINGQTSQYYQLFVEPKSGKRCITIDELLKESFDQSNLQLDMIPKCMILQLPRFGKEFKMFDRVIPSLVIDINDIYKEGYGSCYVCSRLATMKCNTCNPSEQLYCAACIKYHKKKESRTKDRHNTEPVNMQYKQTGLAERSELTSDKCLLPMELFAVICIETSHYVSFVRCGETPNSPWVFFDSMADRVGEEDGYNIPRVEHVNNIVEFLDAKKLKSIKHNLNLPTLIKRLMCDGFICMYQRAKDTADVRHSNDYRHH